MEKRFGGAPRMTILADLGHENLDRLRLTTAYYVDEKGIVRQIFPMSVTSRSDWNVIAAEVGRLVAEKFPS